jgi:putative OPT family oligopeptide transporter
MATSFATWRDLRVGKKIKVPRTERDIPIQYVVLASLLLLIPMFLLITIAIIPDMPEISAGFRYFISGFSAIYILVGGFVFCSVMAYFAGLIGATNSPVSGMSVSALLGLCLFFLLFFVTQTWSTEIKEMIGAIAAIGSLVMIGSALAISNSTMQDLKVGEIVGATPWKQQVMLILGVTAAAVVIPPILQLLFNAYGIGGVYPRPGMNPEQMLAAPQAGLMATVAKGVFSGALQWNMIAIGALIAFVCITIDFILKTWFNLRLPVLAVGIGIYLPLDSSVPLVIGGLLSFIVQMRLTRIYHRGQAGDEEKMHIHRHRGLLLACGLVAGAALMGVLLAFPFALQKSSDALRIMPEQLQPFAGVLGLIATLALCMWIYRNVMRE